MIEKAILGPEWSTIDREFVLHLANFDSISNGPFLATASSDAG